MTLPNCPKVLLIVFIPCHAVISSHTATPLPTITLDKSNLRSLSIRWSVSSPEGVTSYFVYWSKKSAETSRSVALIGTTYNIDGLDSNTAYQVLVMASDPLGSTNSTNTKFYTTPNDVQGKCTICY